MRALLCKDPVDALPAGAVYKAAVDQNDVLHRSQRPLPILSVRRVSKFCPPDEKSGDPINYLSIVRLRGEPFWTCGTLPRNIMHISRRTFNFLCGVVGLGGLAPSVPAYAQDSEKPGEQKQRPHYFFADRTFEMIFLTSLGRAYYSGANPGKVLYLTRQVKDGDFESAFVAFRQAGDDARALAEESLAGGHRESARQAFCGRKTSTTAQPTLPMDRLIRRVFFPHGKRCMTAGCAPCRRSIRRLNRWPFLMKEQPCTAFTCAAGARRDNAPC
jgi:hypothetical protein